MATPTFTDNAATLNKQGSSSHQIKSPTPSPEALFEWAKGLVQGKKTSQELALFGLKTAQDVAKFMKEPIGKGLVNTLAQKFAEEQQQMNAQAAQSREHQLLRHRIMAFLFLLSMSKKSDAVERIHELMSKQNANTLKQEQTNLKNSAESTSKSSIEKPLSDYQHVLREIKDQLRENDQNIQKAQLQADNLHLVGQEIDAKYTAYDKAINDMAVADTFSLDEINIHISALEQTMDEHIQQIDDLIVAGDDAQAREVLIKHNACNTQMAFLKDLINVFHKKTHYFADASGKPVASFKNAAFILSEDENEKIFEKDGKYYLLQTNQTWDSVKENPESLDLAEQRYEKSKHELMTVKELVKDNRGLEVSFHQQCVTDNKKLMNQFKEEQIGLENNKRLVESAHGKLLQLTNTPKPGLSAEQQSTIPAPAPTMKRSRQNTAVPSQRGAAIFHKELLQLIQKVPPLTRDELMNFVRRIPGSNEKLMSFLSELRTGPISPQAQQFIIRNIPRFGIDPIQRSLTPQQGPIHKKQKQHNAEASMDTPTPSPSPKLNPLKTKPDGC